MSRAFWIDPKGRIVDTKINHVTAIIENPKTFGFTSKHIESTYEKYGETLRTEGKARRELIDDAIGRGWIRLRWYRNSHWAITIAKLDRKTKDRITDWARTILKKGIADIKEKDPYIPVKFTALRSRQANTDYVLKDIADGLLTGNKKIVEQVTEFKSFKEFIYHEKH